MKKLSKTNSFILLLVLTFVLSLGFTGCASKSNQASASSGKKTFRIAVSHYSLQNEFTVLISAAQKKEAAKLGVSIDIFGADNDVNTQLGQFQNMIVQKYNAIITSPVDANAMSVGVNQAAAAGIPVIGVNTRVNSNKLTSYVGSQDITAGEMEMQTLATKMGGKGNIVIIEGPIGSSPEIQRNEGIHKVLAKYPDIKVLSSETGNWSRSEGLDLTENWLQAFSGKINGVCSQNDEMALGAIKAIEGVNLLNKIPVVGIDGIADGLAAVKNGTLTSTCFQDAQAQGKLSVDVAVKILKGEKVNANYWIPFQLVTKDNIVAFMKNHAK